MHLTRWTGLKNKSLKQSDIKSSGVGVGWYRGLYFVLNGKIDLISRKSESIVLSYRSSYSCIFYKALTFHTWNEPDIITDNI